jgi:hypothetical protein
MDDNEAPAFTEETAAEVTERYEPSKEAQELLKEGMTPEAFLDALRDDGRLVDAVDFVAYAWPKRRAVWWAVQAVRKGLAELAPKDAAALDAAEAWVLEPTEARRRTAEKAAKALNWKTVPSMTAAAVYFADGTLSEPDTPVIPPPPGLASKMAAAAVNTTATLMGAPEEREDEERGALLALGLALGQTRERYSEVANLLLDAHREAAGNEDRKALCDALSAQTSQSPAVLDDERLKAEMDAFFGPIRAKQEEEAKRLEKIKKDGEEAQKKVKKKFKKPAPPAEPT